MNGQNSKYFTLLEPWLTAAATLLLLMAPTAKAQCSITYSGLQGPLGIVQSNTGNLLVAESGTPVPNTGRISIVDLGGNRRTLLSGLPSGLNDVGAPSGPAGLSLRGRTLYVAIGAGDASMAGPVPGSILPNPNPSSSLFSSVLSLHFSSDFENSTTGFALTFSDQQTLARGGKVALSNGTGEQLIIELVVNFPDYIPSPFPIVPGDIWHSNPFGLVAVGDLLYVTDGGQNKVWQVNLQTGGFGTLVEFPRIPNPLFPALAGPFEEAVPTGITYSGGRLLVPLFRGAPFATGTSSVEQVDPVTGSHSAIITGLTDTIGVMPFMERSNTDHLVLQFASTGPFFGGPGLVLRFDTPNSPATVLTNCLTAPSSMALDQKTETLYVTELTGRIVAVSVVP